MVQLMGVEVSLDPILKWKRAPTDLNGAEVMFMGSEHTLNSDVPAALEASTKLKVVNLGCPGYGAWQIGALWNTSIRDRVFPLLVVVEMPSVGRCPRDPRVRHEYTLQTWERWAVPPNDVEYRRICDSAQLLMSDMRDFYQRHGIPILFWYSDLSDKRNYALSLVPECVMTGDHYAAIRDTLVEHKIVPV
jgi:hypothetical protein